MDLLCSDRNTVITMGIIASGQFYNGRLKYGTLTVCNMIYHGNFDFNGLLNGLGSMTDGNIEYLGQYEHGVMLTGMTLINGIVIERGTYTFTGERKKPFLTAGTKIYDDSTETGTFNSLGVLVEGTIETETSTLTGKFSLNHMSEGTVTYIVDNTTFSATYTLNCDYIMTKCSIRYTGDLSLLNKKQLVFAACSGDYCELSHKFFNKFLITLSPAVVCNDLCDMEFGNLTLHETIALQSIRKALD